MTNLLSDALRSSEVRRYFRRWSRREINAPARVEILVGRTKWTQGTAVVRDVSFRGALLSRLRLKKASLPLKPFLVRLEFLPGKYGGLGALCRPVRFGRGREFEIAVEFEDFWARSSRS